MYIGEGEIFDVNATVNALAQIEGIFNIREGNFIGAVMECEYTLDGRTTIVRLSKDLETVTVDGLGAESMDFAVRFQRALPIPALHVIDMDCSFNLD